MIGGAVTIVGGAIGWIMGWAIGWMVEWTIGCWIIDCWIVGWTIWRGGWGATLIIGATCKGGCATWINGYWIWTTDCGYWMKLTTAGYWIVVTVGCIFWTIVDLARWATSCCGASL